MGLPRFWGRLEGGVILGPGGGGAVASGAVGTSGSSSTTRVRRNSHDDADNEDDDTGVIPPSFATPAPDPNILGLGWTVAYYVLLVTGAVGFAYLLWPLTESTNSLVDFGVKLP